MKVFTHGSNLNFQTSAREVYATDLHTLLQPYQPSEGAILFGSISLEKEVIYLHGFVQQITIHPEGEWRVHYQLNEKDEERQLVQPVEQIVLTQEAKFDIIEQEKPHTYQVFYLTFQENEDEEEITYFLAPDEGVTEPLAYVAEFYRHTAEVGRDIDFAVSGCHAFDLNRRLREQRTN
jgi:hypothetical protein